MNVAIGGSFWVISQHDKYIFPVEYIGKHFNGFIDILHRCFEWLKDAYRALANALCDGTMRESDALP